MMSLVDDDVAEVARFELHVVSRDVGVGADENPVGILRQALGQAGLPVVNDLSIGCRYEGVEALDRRSEAREVFLDNPRLAASRWEDGKEALCALGTAGRHLLKRPLLVLVQGKGAACREAGINKAFRGLAKVREDVILQTTREFEVLG